MVKRSCRAKYGSSLVARCAPLLHVLSSPSSPTVSSPAVRAVQCKRLLLAAARGVRSTYGRLAHRLYPAVVQSAPRKEFHLAMSNDLKGPPSSEAAAAHDEAERERRARRENARRV